MADKKDEKPPEPEAQPPRKKGGKLLFVILPVLGAIAGLGASMAIPKPKAQNDHTKEEPAEEFIDFMLPEIKANLARSGGLHFCGLDIHIRVKSRKMDEVAHKLGIEFSSSGGEGGHGGNAKAIGIPPLGGTAGAIARDRVILLLNAKSIDDLEGREKKELLKKEMKSELEEVLFPGKEAEIDSVLFKDILIQ
jgi:flagellar basal body-associated protein FliL